MVGKCLRRVEFSGEREEAGDREETEDGGVEGKGVSFDRKNIHGHVQN
jgi:hypothetical protein